MTSHICRACLATGQMLYNITEDHETSQAFLDLSGIAINASDNLPQAICTKCLTLLNTFREFRIKVIHNNKLLLQSVEKKSKILPEKVETDQNKHETVKIKQEHESKHDIEAIYLDSETFDNDVNCLEGFKKKEIVPKVKKKKLKKIKTPKLNPRVFIQIDPTKITTVVLSKEEQIRQLRPDGVMPFRCDRCYKGFNYERKLNAHVFNYHKVCITHLSKEEQIRQLRPDGVMPFRCDRCYKGFNYERKLNAHVFNYHKANSEFECGICSRTMRNAASLALHARKHDTRYHCNLCAAVFVEKPRAIAHYKSAHEGLEDEFPCKQCDKVFRNRCTLNGHTRNHHTKAERPRCELCDKTFVSKDSYDDHMLIHTGEKNYNCDQCSRKFRLRQSLVSHMRRHSDARSFTCSGCDAQFKSRNSLLHHLKCSSKHATDEVIKKNTCPTCQRGFSTRYALRKHVRTHSRSTSDVRRAGVKRETTHVCHYCGKGFTTRRALDRHLSTHTRVKAHPQPSNDIKL